MELRCSRDLALWLGAIEVHNVEQHKAMKRTDQAMLVRAPDGRALFWPIATGLTALMRQMK